MGNGRERKAFLELLRCRYGAGSAKRLARLMRRCRPEALRSLILESGLGGFASEIMGMDGVAGALPQGFANRFHVIGAATALQNETVALAAAEAFSALYEAGVPCLLVKGASTLNRLYGSDSLRLTSDVDMFIPREHFDDALIVIRSLGYEYSQEYVDFTGVVMDRDKYLQTNNEAPFVRRGGAFPIGLDVHFELGGFQQGSPLNKIFPINQTDWFAHAETLEISGRPVRCLNLEASLFYMMCHLALHHSFMGVKWLIDLSQAVYRLNDRIDWRKLRSLACGGSLRRVMGCCLALAGAMTGVRRFGPYAVSDFTGRVPVRWLMGRLFDDPESFKAKALDRVTRLMMPDTIGRKLKMLGVYLLHRSTVALRIQSEKTTGYDLLQPVKLAVYAFVQLFAFRKQPKKETKSGGLES